LFEFLSNDGFKFAKSMERMCADMKMMRPAGACAACGGGATFLMHLFKF
jgi:hypothetical protein